MSAELKHKFGVNYILAKTVVDAAEIAAPGSETAAATARSWQCSPAGLDRRDPRHWPALRENSLHGERHIFR